MRVAPGADVAPPVTARCGAFEDGLVEGEYYGKFEVMSKRSDCEKKYLRSEETLSLRGHPDRLRW